MSNYFAWAYVWVILFVSFYPFSGWQLQGESPFAFLFYPIPYFSSYFDLILNVLAYFPLGWGFLLAWRKKTFVFLKIFLFGLCLSCSIEIIQGFLNGRISSNVDILSNTFGTLLGAASAALLFRQRGFISFLNYFKTLFYQEEWTLFGVILLLFSFLSVLNPIMPLFGIVSWPIETPQPIDFSFENPRHYLLFLEFMGAFTHFCVLAGILAIVLKEKKLLLKGVFSIILMAWCLKVGSAAIYLKPAVFFIWFNFLTLSAAVAAAYSMVFFVDKKPFLNNKKQFLISIFCFLMAEGCIRWLWPFSEEKKTPLFYALYGHLSNIEGLANAVTFFWPFIVFGWLVWGVFFLEKKNSDI